MGLVLSGLFFVLGLIFGSFFNVVGLRVPEGRSFVNGRSACPNCNNTLGGKELIPVVSYIFQRGKCRHCKTKISLLYPVVELATGFLFAYSAYMIGLQFELITALLLVSMLMIILVSDLIYMIIPNKVLLFFFPLMIIMRIAVPLDPWWSPIAGGLVVSFYSH
ncbi:Type 4 prepilin-like protein leader peptide-processing enzyme [Lentibacillus sp. JNUCC-1]|nr:Type 4 prepilin-like protein leader peptide-processing enzyme [Lentibacillus sp. JNUCC-1]